jgi:hypothetical protein
VRGPAYAGRQCHRVPLRRRETPDADRQKRQTQIVLRKVSRGDARQPVARGADDEVDCPGVLQARHERGRIAERVGSRERLIEKEPAVIEAADVDADRAWIDPDYARHE